MPELDCSFFSSLASACSFSNNSVAVICLSWASGTSLMRLGGRARYCSGPAGSSAMSCVAIVAK